MDLNTQINAKHDHNHDHQPDEETKRQPMTVRWDLDDGPSAPLFVSILPALILLLLIICLILKYLRAYYDKKRKSDTYVFVDHMGDEDYSNRIDYPTLDRDDPKLNSLVFVEDRRLSRLSRGLDEPDEEPRVRVEASVHTNEDEQQTSSAETVETLINGYEGDDENVGNNADTLPLAHKKRKPITKATESDV